MPLGKGVGLGGMQTFYKAAVTGTGSAQNTPHGQTSAPTLVLIQPRDPSTTTVASLSWDKDNITVTVTNDKTYDILAFWDK